MSINLKFMIKWQHGWSIYSCKYKCRSIRMPLHTAHVVDANVDVVAVVQSVDGGDADVVVNRNVDKVGCSLRCRDVVVRCSGGGGCSRIQARPGPDNPLPPTKLLFLSF